MVISKKTTGLSFALRMPAMSEVRSDEKEGKRKKDLEIKSRLFY